MWLPQRPICPPSLTHSLTSCLPPFLRHSQSQEAVQSMNHFDLGGQYLRVCFGMSPPQDVIEAVGQVQATPLAAAAAAAAAAPVAPGAVPQAVGPQAGPRKFSARHHGCATPRLHSANACRPPRTPTRSPLHRGATQRHALAGAHVPTHADRPFLTPSRQRPPVPPSQRPSRGWRIPLPGARRRCTRTTT